MFTAELERKSLDDWRAGISRKFRRRFVEAQAEIRREFQAEFYRQLETHGDGAWQQLSPNGYAKRKDAEQAKGYIQYGSGDILRRTGVMVEGYISGIEIPTPTRTRVSVTIHFPENTLLDSKVTDRAVGHQESPPSENHPLRPFNVDKFAEIGERIFNEAMSKAAND